ncbi:hypothetical protein [Streptosporangium sp. NPDC023615]|uniref:hypothetical protein n=1 Tax=Streptosporangium sp. NPDC023615 TaxID=3154794 RepID=UPI00342698A2
MTGKNLTGFLYALRVVTPLPNHGHSPGMRHSNDSNTMAATSVTRTPGGPDMERGMSMRRSAAALVLVPALALSGCTGGKTFDNPTTARITQGNHEALDVSILRVAESDFQAFSSPEALAKDQSIVTAGVVDGWQEGPALATYPNGPLEHRVFLRIKVTDPLKGVGEKKMVFVDLFRGAVVRDDFRKPEEWLPRKSLEDFEKSIPTGTRAVVFADERIPREDPVVKNGDAVPDDAVLTGPPPQGLVFEDQTRVRQKSAGDQTLVGGIEPLDVAGTRSGWTEPKNMDDLISRLKSHGFSE